MLFSREAFSLTASTCFLGPNYGPVIGLLGPKVYRRLIRTPDPGLKVGARWGPCPIIVVSLSFPLSLYNPNNIYIYIYGHAPAGSPPLPPPWYGPYLLRSKSRLNYNPPAPPVVLWPVVWFSSKL